MNGKLLGKNGGVGHLTLWE